MSKATFCSFSVFVEFRENSVEFPFPFEFYFLKSVSLMYDLMKPSRKPLTDHVRKRLLSNEVKRNGKREGERAIEKKITRRRQIYIFNYVIEQRLFT